ncbi:MAG: entericidin A/B family lipoprotein [Burkholderiales bacterium]|nr:entericidin A/B family lipoprotein [Burkholderiales bacterium]
MIQKIVAILAALLFLAGCNTMEGAGKDLERGGEKVQEKAK